MIKYSYKLNEEGLVERSIQETYPDIDIFERGINNKKMPDLIKKQYLKALQGEAESDLIKIEEDWYNIQKKIEKLTKELKEINDKLNGVQEVIDEETGEIKVKGVEKVKDKVQREKLIKRLEEINDKEEYIYDDYGKKVKTIIKGELSLAQEERERLEQENEFLKGYRGLKTDAKRPNPSENVKLPREKVKRLIAHERDLTVRNIEDTVADLAKTNSILMDICSALWSIISDDAKKSIPKEKREIIDYAIQKFAQIQTRADYQLKEEGIKLIDKIYDREEKIAEIIKKY